MLLFYYFVELDINRKLSGGMSGEAEVYFFFKYFGAYLCVCIFN